MFFSIEYSWSFWAFCSCLWPEQLPVHFWTWLPSSSPPPSMPLFPQSSSRCYFESWPAGCYRKASSLWQWEGTSLRCFLFLGKSRYTRTSMKMFVLAVAASRCCAVVCLNPPLSCLMPFPVTGIKFWVPKITMGGFLYQYTYLAC